MSVYEWKERAAEVTLYRSPQHSQTLHTMQPQAPPSQCLVCQFLNKPLTQVYNDGYSQMVYILVVLKKYYFFLGGGGGVEISSFDLQRMWMDWAENMPKDFEGSMFNDPQ